MSTVCPFDATAWTVGTGSRVATRAVRAGLSTCSVDGDEGAAGAAGGAGVAAGVRDVDAFGPPEREHAAGLANTTRESRAKRWTFMLVNMPHFAPNCAP